MKHFYDNQFNYACGSALMALLILAAGASWKYSFFYYGLYPDHLARLVATMLLITSLAWLTDFTVDKTASGTRARAWYGVNGALAAYLAGWTVWGFVDFVNDTAANQTRLDVTALIFFGVVVVLFCMATWLHKRRPSIPAPSVAAAPDDLATPSNHPGDEDDLHSRWGKVASLIIMILALYAFGLRFESGKLEMHWAEVPAILVVFVLAELGVHLVVTARRIQTNVWQSSELSGRAVSDARTAVAAAKTLSEKSTLSAEALQKNMESIEQQASELVGKLQEVSSESAERLRAVEVEYRSFLERLAPLEKSGCYAASNSLYKQLGMESIDYWKKIATFAQSWDLLAEEKPGTKRLLNVLFSSYIGDTVEDGSIRRRDTSVACITADAVFAEVSEKWLDEMVSMPDHGSPLVVWAVTKLLPTEFALPGFWLGTDERGERASRVQSLERFISSVLRACRRDQSEVEYRRVTVIEDVDYRRAKGEHKEGDGESTPLGDLLSNSLENWMLWDPRVQPSQLPPRGDVAEFDRSETLLRALLLAYGKPDAIRSEEGLRWSSLKEFFEEHLGFSVGVNHAPGMLPSLPAKDDGAEVLLFQYDFSSASSEGRANEEARISHGPHRRLDGETGAVLGGSKGFLDHRFGWTDIPISKISVGAREALRESLSSGSKSAREILEQVGWQSVKKWYCKNLHNGEEAWWTVMNKDNEAYFDPLLLKWNGASVLTLDLLLIGRRRKKDEIDWQGAAISNLSFDRTECTVQLVAKSAALKQIDEVVEGLCNGRSGSDYGKWENWPLSLS